MFCHAESSPLPVFFAFCRFFGEGKKNCLKFSTILNTSYFENTTEVHLFYVFCYKKLDYFKNSARVSVSRKAPIIFGQNLQKIISEDIFG